MPVSPTGTANLDEKVSVPAIVEIELDTPTIARVMPKKIKRRNGLASQARQEMGSPNVIVRFANRGLGYERFSEMFPEPDPPRRRASRSCEMSSRAPSFDTV